MSRDAWGSVPYGTYSGFRNKIVFMSCAVFTNTYVSESELTSSILGSRLKILVLNPASTSSRSTRDLYLFLPCYYVYECDVTAVVTIGIVRVRVPLDCMVEIVVSTLLFSSVRTLYALA